MSATAARPVRSPVSLDTVRARSTVIAGAAIVGLALALRLINHSSNYDIFVDEITYAAIGKSVATGHGVILYGSPFFLHPPGFFYLEGALLWLFGGARTRLGLVLDLRLINCVIGAIECGLVMVLVNKLTRRAWMALGAGLFVAIDPFVLLWDGRVLLETLAMTLTIGGWLCLVALSDLGLAGGQRRKLSGGREWALVVLGGVLFGLSLLTNETYAFVSVVPLGVLFLLGSPLRRGRSFVMLVIAFLCYIGYLLSVLADGLLNTWWYQQRSGLQRAVGTKQISGFNQSGHASFLSRIGADLHLYLVSYLVVAGIAAAAAFWVVHWYRTARAGRALPATQRLATVLAACGVAYVGYAGLRGAFEEQIFYMCVMGGVPLLAVSAEAAWSRWGRGLRRGPLVAWILVGVAAVAFELAVDVRIRTTRDSALTALVTYVREHVPYLAPVDATDGVSQFILQDVRIGQATTLPAVERGRPHYVVIASSLDQQGYVHLGPGFQRWLNRDGHVIFRTRDRQMGEVMLYHVHPPPPPRPKRVRGIGGF